jgi:hypothetical protein
MEFDLTSAEGCLRGVQWALRRERWARAERFAGLALAAGSGLPRLKHVFDAAGKPELLLRATWKHRDALFKDVRTVASFARLAGETEFAEEYFAKLGNWTPPSVAERPTFTYPDCLSAYVNLDDRVLIALFRLKYGAWDPTFSGDVLQNAARQVDSLHVAAETAEFYYRRASQTGMEFPAWLREFKTAQTLHHAFSDALVVRRLLRNADSRLRIMIANFGRMANFREYVDLEEARRIFLGADRSRGLLVSTFHGGFLSMSNALYTISMPNPHWLTIASKGPNVIKVPGNERAAAFQAYRALTNGNAVLIAGDGFHFEGGTTVEILGLKAKISEGSAALAYESNCNTAWISASRRGDRFVLDYVPGPHRSQGENYKTFRDRWLSFYVGQIERALSLGPESLVLSARWGTPHGPHWN